MKRIVAIVLYGCLCLPVHSQLMWPVDKATALHLALQEVDVRKLFDALGIDPAAEGRWTTHRERVCPRIGVAPTKCSSEGRTLEEMRLNALSGDPLLQNNYAHSLRLHSESPEAEAEAWKFFMAAAEQGLPHAQVTVGWKLLHGLGVQRDPEKAFEWNLKGARQGHPEGANNVAFQYEHGIGVRKSYEAAVNWYTYASLRGSTIAMGALLYLKRERR